MGQYKNGDNTPCYIRALKHKTINSNGLITIYASHGLGLAVRENQLADSYIEAFIRENRNKVCKLILCFMVNFCLYRVLDGVVPQV